MKNIALSSAIESPLQSHEQESQLLGQLVRTSRLVLLFGEPGSEKSELLKSGLMPLLRRRTGDHLGPTAARESGVVIPFPDRRQHLADRTAKRRRELVVYFADWSAAPLAGLLAGIRLAAAAGTDDGGAPPLRLAATLRVLCDRLDANFIILLDHFEDFLLAPSGNEEIARFGRELVETINQAQLPANFLLSLNEESRTRLANLCSRIPGFDDFSLRLAPTKPSGPPESIARKAPPLQTEVLAEPEIPSTPARSQDAPFTPRTTVSPRVKRSPPPRVPVKTEDVYALIESTLARTGARNPCEPFVPDAAVGQRSGGCAGLAGDEPAPPAETTPRLPGESADGGLRLSTEASSKAKARGRATLLHSVARWVKTLLRHPVKPRREL